MNPAGPPVVAARLREEGLVAIELAGAGYGLYLQDVLDRRPISELCAGGGESRFQVASMQI